MFHVSRYQLKHVSPDIISSIVTPTFNVQSRLIGIAVLLQGRYLMISDDNAKWKVPASGQPMQFICFIFVKKKTNNKATTKTTPQICNMSDFTLQDESQTPGEKPKTEAATLMRVWGMFPVDSDPQFTAENIHQLRRKLPSSSSSYRQSQNPAQRVEEAKGKQTVCSFIEHTVSRTYNTFWPRQYITQS